MFLLWQNTNVWERSVKLGGFIFNSLPQTPASSDWCQECIPAQAGSFQPLLLISAQQKPFISISVPLQLISSSVKLFVSPIVIRNPLKRFCNCSDCFTNCFIAYSLYYIKMLRNSWRFCHHHRLLSLQTSVTLFLLWNTNKNCLVALLQAGTKMRFLSLKQLL